MIGRVVSVGDDVAGVLYYLFGPGRRNEHVRPRLVAAWDDPPDLEPPMSASGRRDFRRLTGLLEQPVAALGKRAPRKYVWHCVIRAAPEDRDLEDGEWPGIIAEVMHRTGLSERGSEHEGVRWVAVHHGDQHVHIVATLARQDRRRARTGNLYYRIGEAMREVERRYGLREVIRADRTAARRPTRGEQDKARRAGRTEPPRVELRRHVEAAAAASCTEAEFFAELTRRGVQVRLRHGAQRPDEVTGYAVGLPDDATADDGQVWYGGGKLAADLTLPKLRRTWVPASAGHGLSAGASREEAYQHAAAAARQAIAAVKAGRRGSGDTARAAAGLLATAADVTGSPELRHAADALARAARAPWGRIPAPSPAGQALRSAARVLVTSRPRGQRPGTLLVLLVALIDLTRIIAELRAAQRRHLQAVAARDAVLALNRAVATASRELTVADPRAFPAPPRPRRVPSSNVASGQGRFGDSPRAPRNRGRRGPAS